MVIAIWRTVTLCFFVKILKGTLYIFSSKKIKYQKRCCILGFSGKWEKFINIYDFRGPDILITKKYVASLCRPKYFARSSREE